MIERLARELSPAQALIREFDCFFCQNYVLQSHFQMILKLIEEKTHFNSWEQKRLCALLSAMYLEAVQELNWIDDQTKESPMPELLIAKQSWPHKPKPCPYMHNSERIVMILHKMNQQLIQMCQDVLGDSAVRLIEN